MCACRSGRRRGSPWPWSCSRFDARHRARSRQTTEPVRLSSLDPAARAAAGLGPRHRAGPGRRPVAGNRRRPGSIRRHGFHRVPAKPRRVAWQLHHGAGRRARRIGVGGHAGRCVAPQRRALHQLQPRQWPGHADGSDLFESRDGSIWAVGGRIVSAFRGGAIVNYGPEQGVPAEGLRNWSRPPTACCSAWAFPRSCGSTASVSNAMPTAAS